MQISGFPGHGAELHIRVSVGTAPSQRLGCSVCETASKHVFVLTFEPVPQVCVHVLKSDHALHDIGFD